MDQVKKNNLNSYLPGHDEWVLSNGIGGYSSLSSTSECERKHHALLVASKCPPTNRVVLLQNIIEQVFIPSDKMNQSNLSLYLKEFSMNGVPQYRYVSKSFTIIKTIAPGYKQNSVAIVYDIEPHIDFTFVLTPLFNHRSHSDVSSPENLSFLMKNNKNSIILQSISQDSIYFHFSEGILSQRMNTITKGIEFIKDQSTGDDRIDHAFQPVDITIELVRGKKKSIEFYCSDIEQSEETPSQIIENTILHQKSLINQSNLSSNDDELNQYLKRLVVSASEFVVYRQSTNSLTVLAGYPWFTDWGRDTMISFEGLLLVTKRYKEGLDVLSSFTKYMKNGLIPNMFPDEGLDPLYNTVDASLWYIHAIYEYYKYTSDLKSVLELFFPVMKSIISHYESGTDNHIFMDTDGLIHAGSGLDQVTWMDVRINGEVITPRHGKPVEINALWYNALQIMNHFEILNQSNQKKYFDMAITTKNSFLSKFWNTKNHCLYDVVEPNDSSIRPNQLYAVSLPFSMLDENQKDQILKIMEEELVDVYGIRTLSIHDSRFIGEYSGDIVKRDHAYHMGTSWGFLMGTYLVTLLKTGKRRELVGHKLRQVLKTLDEGCINSIAEVFDGFEGYGSKGCFAQAWSVAEILRALALFVEGENDENR